MISLLFDIGLGYLIAKNIPSKIIMVIVAIIAGWIGAAIGRMLFLAIVTVATGWVNVVVGKIVIYTIWMDRFWHPIVTVIAAFVFRSRMAKQSATAFTGAM